MKRFLRLGIVFAVLAAFFGVRKATTRARTPKPAPSAQVPEPIKAAPSSPTPANADPEPPLPEEARLPELQKEVVEVATGPKSLRWLLAHQNSDGSWGDGSEMVEGRLYTKTSATAIALLSFLGAGYSHLSKDEMDGIVTGKAILKALEFLKNSSDHDALSQCTASLALIEAYGMTGSAKFKEAAEEALARVAKLQGADGSWNGDLLTSLWAAEVVASGTISGLSVPADIGKRAAPYFREEILNHGDAAAAVGVIFLTRDRNDPSLGTARQMLSAMPPDPSQKNFAYWYLGSLAMFQLDGAQGAGWKAWNPKLKETVLGTQDRSGEWKGEGGATASVVRTGLGTLALEVYYRYDNVLK